MQYTDEDLFKVAHGRGLKCLSGGLSLKMRRIEVAGPEGRAVDDLGSKRIGQTISRKQARPGPTACQFANSPYAARNIEVSP